MVRKGLLLLLVFVSMIAFAQNKKWKLVWKDEFNYTGLPDSSKWSYDLGGDGWGNHELEYYTNKRKENARAENGYLVIEARKEDYQGMKYTSARLVTKGKGDWQHGKIEVKAKLPKGVGTWPAIWMLPSKEQMTWPDDGELDIMEHVGFHHGLFMALSIVKNIIIPALLKKQE